MPNSTIDWYPIYEWAKQQREPFTAYAIEKALGLPINSASAWLKSEAFITDVYAMKRKYTIDCDNFDDFVIRVKQRFNSRRTVVTNSVYSTVAGELQLLRNPLHADLLEDLRHSVQCKQGIIDYLDFANNLLKLDPKDWSEFDLKAFIHRSAAGYATFSMLADICADIVSDPRARELASARYAIARSKDN